MTLICFCISPSKSSGEEWIQMGTEHTLWTHSRGKETSWAKQPTAPLHQCLRGSQTDSQTLGFCTRDMFKPTPQECRQIQALKPPGSKNGPFPPTSNTFHSWPAKNVDPASRYTDWDSTQRPKEGISIRLNPSISPTDGQRVYGLARIPAVGLQH